MKNLEDIKLVIDNRIEVFKDCNNMCPKEHLKNHYLKACWLLSQFQRDLKYARRSNLDINIKSNLATWIAWIEQSLPILRDLKE